MHPAHALSAPAGCMQSITCIGVKAVYLERGEDEMEIVGVLLLVALALYLFGDDGVQDVRR